MPLTKEQLSRAIKMFRSINNMTQLELAEKLGTSAMQIIRWENKKTLPNLLSTKALIELGVLNLTQK